MSFGHDQHRRSAAWDIIAGPRNYLTLVLTQVFGSLAALVTVWLLSHLLGTTGYGQIAAIIAAAYLIGTGALNWSAMSLSRIGCEEFVQTGRITKTFWARTFILILSWLLILASMPFWLQPISIWLHLTHEAQVLLFVYLAAVSLWGHVQYALQGAKLQSLMGQLMAAERALILTGALILAINGGSLRGAILAYVVGAATAALIGIWRLRHLIGRPVIPDLPVLKKIFLFSLPLIPHSLVGYFSTNYLDAWFILRHLTASDLGIYSIAYQLAGTVMQLPVLVGTLLLPMFTTLEVTRDDERSQEYLRDILPILSLSWALAGTIMAGALVFLLPLIFGAQFTATARLMWPLMAASVIAGPMSMGYVPLLNAKSTTGALAVSATAAAATNVLLNSLLIPRWGLLGCAWATVGSYLVSLSLAGYLLWRWCGLNGGQAFKSTLPLIIGAGFAALTGNNWGAFLLTCALIFGLAFSCRKALIMGGQRLSRIWARKYGLTLLSET